MAQKLLVTHCVKVKAANPPVENNIKDDLCR